jgi:hypothetical protein
LQSKVGKFVGKNNGPPVGKKLIFFIDDINMPTVDTYRTQQPISFFVRLLTTELFSIDKPCRTNLLERNYVPCFYESKEWKILH